MEEFVRWILMFLAFGIAALGLNNSIQNWRREAASMREEEADWAEIDEIVEQLKSAGLWGPPGSHPEADRLRERIDSVYNKWMNRHHGTFGFDYNFRPTHRASNKTQWWKTLEVSQDASWDEIQTAYRRLVKKHHPDCGGTNEKFVAINQAYLEAKIARRPTTKRPAAKKQTSPLLNA